MSRAWIALSAVALLVGCGGAPETLPQAEKAVEARQWDKAERLFGQAGRSYLTESEKARVRAGMAQVAAAKIKPKLDAANTKPGWAGYKAVAEVRRWYLRTGGTKNDGADQVTLKVLEARATALWPEVEVLRSRKHFVGADAKAADVLGPLPKGAGEALRAKREALRKEAAAFHQAQAPESAPPGARALHAGLVKRFGGTAASPLAALKAEATVGLSVSHTGGKCAKTAQALAAGIGRQGQTPAKIDLKIDTCATDQNRWSRQEPYSYTVKIPQVEYKRVRTGSEYYVVERKTCTRKMPGAYMREGRVVKTMTTTTYDCSVTGQRPTYGTRKVTTYRTEHRQGTRQVNYESNSVRYGGRVTVTWAGGTRTFQVQFKSDAKDHAYRTPHGSKSIEYAKSLPGLEGAGRRALINSAVAGARRRVLAADAARFEAQAAKAFAAGHFAEAEDADVRASLRGPVLPGTAQRFNQRYGLTGSDVMRALEGEAYKSHTTAWQAGYGDQLRVGRSATYESGEQYLERGWAWGTVEYGLRGMGTLGLPHQRDRHSASFYMRLSYPFLAHLDEDSEAGWTLYDAGHLDVWLGGRTSTSHDYTSSDEDEGALSGGIGLGYQFMLGYRGKLLGLFGGLRTQNTFRRVGDFVTAGASHPWIGRLEMKFSERHPVVLQAYGFPPIGHGEVWGADLNIALGLSHAMVLRAEKLKVDALFGGLRPDDEIDLGRQESWVIDVNYALQF